MRIVTPAAHNQHRVLTRQISKELIPSFVPATTKLVAA